MYIITEQTIAVIVDKSGYFNTRIIQGSKQYYSTKTAMKILKYNCRQNGTTFDRRLSFSKDVLVINSKLPVSICPKRRIYMFPTSSSKKDRCIWFCYYHVKRFVKYDSGTRVYLSNNTDIIVDISYHQFDLQMKRTSQIIAEYNSPHKTLLYI